METTLKMRLYTAVIAIDAAYQSDMLHNHQTYALHIKSAYWSRKYSDIEVIRHIGYRHREVRPVITSTHT